MEFSRFPDFQFSISLPSALSTAGLNLEFRPPVNAAGIVENRNFGKLRVTGRLIDKSGPIQGLV
jgi:hypothetical protein